MDEPCSTPETVNTKVVGFDLKAEGQFLARVVSIAAKDPFELGRAEAGSPLFALVLDEKPDDLFQGEFLGWQSGGFVFSHRVEVVYHREVADESELS